MSNQKEILRQAMFVLYARSNESKTDDAIIVKERLRCKETGREKPHLRIVENPKRPFWISNKETQKQHKQKRDFEYTKNLNEFECTQAELPYRVGRALGRHGGYARLSELCREPYVYGTDIPVTVLHKNRMDKANAEKNGSWVADYSVAVMDFETNVHSKREEIVSGALSFKDKAVIAVTKDFVSGLVDVEKRLAEECKKYLEKDILDRNMKIKIEICENDWEVCKTLMCYSHTLKPDFLTFWNMNFDIKKMLDCCHYYNKDPAFLFSDPSIPKKYRHFRYREDAVSKTSVSGKKMNKDPSECWHVVECPASFFVIDAMCVFRMLRVVKGKRHSYALDAILEAELGIRKLEIPGVEGNHNLAWHRKMQRDQKLPYLVYNLFDCISVEMLDEKTTDLSKRVGLYADGSDLGSLASNPKRLANAIHLYLQDYGKVLCATSDDMTEKDFDYEVLDKRDWIVTLANELADESGIALFEELPYLLSRVAIAVADIDITSGYPNAQFIGNISKSTTLAEVCRIKGLTKADIKRLAVDLMACPANAIQIGADILKMPTPEEWVEMYDQDIEQEKVEM
jgi:hypothetical protein